MRVFAEIGGTVTGLSSLSAPLTIGLGLAVLFLLALWGTAALIVWRVYRRVRRWRGWHRGAAAATRARALRPGPARDVVRLRHDLRAEVEAADVMLSRAKDGRLFIADARALVDELKIHAAEMDADLASVQDYADTDQQRSALDALRPQVTRLIETSYLARQTMLQTEIADRERHLTDLSDHVERQAAALRIYRRGAHGLDLSDPHGNPAHPSSSPSRGQANTRLHPPGWSSPRSGLTRRVEQQASQRK
ncbi:hypothetical protein ABEG17_04395 [Pedococcus sp. KACC 23699]|uniref:Uncharacterized protein n=1 Tax=Pedococcus sp. KACC 23699 TaxID=3149228 RepID=A0AAU7JWF1_9MICO